MRIGGLFLMLLMGVGLYLWLSADNAQKVVTASAPSRQAAAEVSGQGMKESFGVQVVEKDGRPQGLELKALVPGGMMASMYDLKLGDLIVGVGPFTIKDTESEMLYSQLLESGIRQHKLVVLRGGERLTLENHGAAARLGGNGGGQGSGQGRLPGGNLNPLGN